MIVPFFIGNVVANTLFGGRLFDEIKEKMTVFFKRYIVHPGWFDLQFRMRTARILQPGFWARFKMSGFEIDEIDAILGEIESLDGWYKTWTRVAFRYWYLAETLPKDDPRKAWLYHKSAMAFHYSIFYGWVPADTFAHIQWVVQGIEKKGYHLYTPPIRTWSTRFKNQFRIPGLIWLPEDKPTGLIVMVPGLNFVKEEMIPYAYRFVRAGLAVVLYDEPKPNTIEDIPVCFLEQKELLNTIHGTLKRRFRILRNVPVGLFGLSLGAWRVLKMAEGNPDVNAVVAVSPFADAFRSYESITPVLHEQLELFYWIDVEDPAARAQFYDTLERAHAGRFVHNIRCPVFLAGGGQDKVVPGEDTLWIFEHLRSKKRLYYDTHGTHMLMERIFELLPKYIDFLQHNLSSSHM